MSGFEDNVKANKKVVDKLAREQLVEAIAKLPLETEVYLGGGRVILSEPAIKELLDLRYPNGQKMLAKLSEDQTELHENLVAQLKCAKDEHGEGLGEMALAICQARLALFEVMKAQGWQKTEEL